MTGTRRGFALIFCLLLSVFLLIVSMAFLGQRNPYYQAALAQQQAAQAHTLAEAALDDFRAKLGKDLNFPPPTSPNRPEFSYSYDLTLPNGQPCSYRVKCIHSFQGAPFWVLRVWCTGLVGTRERPLAERTLYAEIDTSPVEPRAVVQADTVPNNNERYRILFIREGESQER